MQERGKDEASGANAALSSDQAEQLAADFTPAWDTGDADSDDAAPADAPPAADEQTTRDAISDKSLVASHATGNGNGNGSTLPLNVSANATLVDFTPPVIAPEPTPRPAPPIEPKPVILAKNQTLIGSAIAPATPPPPPVAQQPAPELSRELAAQIAREAREVPAEPIPPPRSIKPMAPIAEAKDPFAGPASKHARPVHPEEHADLGVPKKSGKGVLFVILGLAIAGGLGVFLKFALTDDSPKPKEPAQASSPPITPPTTDVPPPPPPDEAPPPAATVKKAGDDPKPIVKNDPPPVSPPVVRNNHHAAPANPDRPPAVKNDPPPAPKPPAPKPGGIVHENPF